MSNYYVLGVNQIRNDPQGELLQKPVPHYLRYQPPWDYTLTESMLDAQHYDNKALTEKYAPYYINLAKKNYDQRCFDFEHPFIGELAFKVTILDPEEDL